MTAYPMQAGSSLNIAIQDSKDFPGDVAQAQDLYSEFTMADGRALFECPGLVKATGIDLMNCPLTVVLKLRVRRRLPQGAVVLWHVVLPLPLISKYLLQPPHEWETWIGLFPNTQSLEAYPPETMFTQAVYLINRPDFPKLRLRFTYHNPELQAQISAQNEAQQQESRRRKELCEKVGRQQFEEIHKLTRDLRGENSERDRDVASVPAAMLGGNISDTTDVGSRGADATTAADAVTAVPADGLATPKQQAALALGSHKTSEEPLREALASALAFIGGVHQMLARHLGRGPGAQQLPQALGYDDVVASSTPSALIDSHCLQLHQCLCAAAFADAPLTQPAGGADMREAERLLTDGLQMALLGMLDDAEDAKLLRTAASNEQLGLIQTRFPSLWESYREVSSVAKERAGLIERVSTLTRGEHGGSSGMVPSLPSAPTLPQDALSATPASLEALRHTDSEELLAQKRQVMGNLRQQLEETRRLAEEREGELGQFRAHLSELTRQRASTTTAPAT